MDKNGYTNIIHYGSPKYKQVRRSMLAFQLLATVHGFHILSIIRLTLNAMLDHFVLLHVYTVSQSLYTCFVCINQTPEKRLMIDLRMLHQSYERQEISKVSWIPMKQNYVDAFTKRRACPTLKQLLHKNRLLLTPNA